MDFIEIYKKKLETHIDIKGFESKSTGLKVHVADVDSAMYNAYFCLATEAHSDDGLPHTLEHLIFLGSSKYPYKGSLDIVSNRNFARGTNAWTDVDHTCYTIEVASFQGFINIMDIYLDHILNASITKEGFITEVHHITNDGDDGGVVYCEMQQTENTSECLTEEEMLRTLYDEKCGYRYNTGGKMVNLRHTTTHEKIVDYHKKFYHPQNLSIIVTGKINSAEIEKMLNSLEDCFKTGILSKKMENYTKPWSTLPNQMTSHISHINFPSDTETHGNIRIAWRVCPESDLDYQVRRLTSSYYCVSFDEVNTKKMNFVVAKSFKILKDIVNGIIKIDVNHLKNLILRKYANELAAVNFTFFYINQCIALLSSRHLP
ncbi:hypothetical protein A3Q56_02843 [Intoshia linei]|uniref:Peptidase M16 N-terminal domain-containing protein n=1 Tax=Intoshia linei TaxID=1819745 RepID=A0A177B6W7_9BILA|nr:hypothetical protein A3Q56_02843 [Intoshia linei]